MSHVNETCQSCNLIDAMVTLAKVILVVCITFLITTICPSLLRNWYVYQKDLQKRQSAETKRAMKKVFILPAVDHTGPRAVSATDILSSREYRNMLVEPPHFCPSYDYSHPREFTGEEFEMLTDEEADERH